VWLSGAHYHFTLPKAASWEEDGGPHQQHGKTVTPMPGRVVKVVQARGALLKKGDPVLILEAMKMEVRGLGGWICGFEVARSSKYDFLDGLE
jgi:acetyl/propionyl-CoA carboxylase alpha subunit